MIFSSEKELISYYSKFRNSNLNTLKKFTQNNFPEIKLKTNKGIVGQVLESLIGNSPNNDPNPDVLNLGIELKVMPLRKSSNSLVPKERSKIKKINYNSILDESWDTSFLKKKISKILFFLYEQPIGKTYRDWEEFTFLGTLLFDLQVDSYHIIKNDWLEIQKKVKSHLAHELSEGDSKVLGACTSGTGKIEKYDGLYEAKERSYSLKHNYLKLFYLEKYKKKKFENLNIVINRSFEEDLIAKLDQNIYSKTLDELVKKFNIENINFSKNKSAFHLLLKRIFNINPNIEIRDFEENNIVVKTIPVNSAYKPYESMSFNKFSLSELVYQDWNGDNDDDDSLLEADFKNSISKTFVFIPIIKRKNKKTFNAWQEWVVGKPVLWSPSSQEFATIEKEWSMTKQIIVDGVNVWKEKHGSKFRQRNNLTKESETEIIHIRPKARDSKDIDKDFYKYSNGQISISYQCFWLNKKFVYDKIKPN